eukprot:1138243-Pleurochrysis_carterae.AAC.1
MEGTEATAPARSEGWRPPLGGPTAGRASLRHASARYSYPRRRAGAAKWAGWCRESVGVCLVWLELTTLKS